MVKDETSMQKFEKILLKAYEKKIYFDKKSKETFQDKMFKVIHSKGK